MMALSLVATTAGADTAWSQGKARPGQPEGDQRVVTIMAHTTVPILDLNVSGVLVLTLTGSGESFDVDWTFRGQRGSRVADASGTGVGSFHGDELSLTLTSIASWDVPGFPQPVVPKTASVTPLRFNVAVVSVPSVAVFGLPISVHPRFANPFESRWRNYVVASTGTGAIRYARLPGMSQAASD
jgi:hypothetical protein